MGKILTGIIIIAIIVVGIILFTGKSDQGRDIIDFPPPAGGPPPAATVTPPPAAGPTTAPNTGFHGTDKSKIPALAAVIKISDKEVSLRSITVKEGATVYFVNDGKAEHWPATALHPTHVVYPNSDIKKCGTAEANKIFDSCRGVKPGEFWAFTFGDSGLWRWHDHLNASQLNGSITVEEPKIKG